MRLTIIGAGAIGGVVGAHMIRAGHDVLLCDADEAHVDAINARGLAIEGPVGAFTVPAKAVTPDRLPDTIERAAIAVKSHHTAAAAEPLRDRLAPHGYVVSLQNGLPMRSKVARLRQAVDLHVRLLSSAVGNDQLSTADTIAAVVGRDRLVASFVNFGADVVGPGRIMQGNVATFRIGELDGRVTDRVRELVTALPYAEATDNVLGFLWGKEAYGAMLYAGAVSDLPIADTLDDPRWRPLMLAVAREVLAQAPARPEPFDGFDPDDLDGSLTRLAAFNRRSAKSHSGIYRDLMVRNRRTEVDDLLRDLAGPLTKYTGELIRAIERGERTCEVANLDLLAAYERCERIGRRLGAVVSVLSAPARAPDGPLHGVVVAVKDLVDVAGVPRGSGNPAAMAGTPAAADAPVVAALRRAGADVFATTALLEYAAGALHPDVPETRNPYDESRTAGGSSGGSAALVGAGVCPVALGTDTGGSIRLPAHYCGVVGFKPSFGVLEVAGVQPLAPSLDHVGLLARDVETAARTFTALTGTPVPLTLLTPRIGVLAGSLTHPALDGDVRAVVGQAVETLRLAGCGVTETDATAFDQLAVQFEDILLWEVWQVHGPRVDADPEHYGPTTLRLLRSGAGVTRSAYEKACARRDELRPRVESAYEGIDVLLTPAGPFTAPVTTPPVDTPDGEREAVFSAVHNLSGDPAVALPCGWGDGGLPVGVQMSARRGRDAELLAAAATVERMLAVPVRTPASGSAR